MNFLIGSDIHGSKKYAEMFFAKDKIYQSEKIIVLGDFFYNGARNLPPEEYSPKEVVALVNSFADKLIAIKGNCESEADQMVADLLFSDNPPPYAFGKTCYLTHGHHYGFGRLGFALFNLIFVPLYYKSPDSKNVGATLLSYFVTLVFFGVVMAVFIAVPGASSWISSWSGPGLWGQIGIFAGGAILFFLLNALAYKLGSKSFQKIDL